MALLDLKSSLEAANAEAGGSFEGQFDTVLAALTVTGLSSLLEGEALHTVRSAYRAAALKMLNHSLHGCFALEKALRRLRDSRKELECFRTERQKK